MGNVNVSCHKGTKVVSGKKGQGQRSFFPAVRVSAGRNAGPAPPFAPRYATECGQEVGGAVAQKKSIHLTGTLHEQAADQGFLSG